MSGSNEQLPVVMTAAGPLPQSPATLLQQLTTLVTFGTDPAGNTNVITPYPGYTNTLPGSMIADISGTDVAAMVLMDQARLETINSLTPFGANEFLLLQMGTTFGIPVQSSINTSVDVVFEGTAGYIIPIGFLVTDGTNTYSVVSGGVVETGGYSQPLYCLALNAGSWAVPPNSVNALGSSVATGFTLSCTNPIAGTPSAGDETTPQYRARVLTAETVTCQATPAMIKTLLGAIPGTVFNTISVQQGSNSGMEIICGGGDPYAIGYAIYQAVPDLNTIVGSTLHVESISLATNGVVTTDKNHLFTTGQVIQIAGATPTQWNASYTITVLSPTTFELNVNTSSYSAYVSGGVITPNLRNATITLFDYPDTYTIPYVIPPQQTCTVALSWNTTSSSFVSSTTFNQSAQAAIIAYINALGVGQPINLMVLQSQVLSAVSTLLAANLVSLMNWTVTLNGVSATPISGTSIIQGDPESTMLATTASVTVNQA